MDDTMTADEARGLLVACELSGARDTLAARALRTVIALHAAASVPPHGAAVYRGDRLPPHLAARVEGVEGAAEAALVVEYRDPDAPGAGPAEWDSRAAAKRAAGLGDATWCGVAEGTGVVVVHDAPAPPRGGG